MQAIMDQPYEFSERTHEQSIAAKQRFESFKLGSGRPLSTPSLGLSKPSHGRSHSRSHSRNTSISSISSMSNLSVSVSVLSQPPAKPTTDMSTSPIAGPPKQRPNSHHRRRSSVSTRRESAEMMGVSVPDLPPSKLEDNINLGDKDSIRRRALWALEGKGDVAFSKVEIPDFVSPEKENSGFNFPSKPSFPPGTGASFGAGLSTLAEKRNSMGKFMVSASSKDQLHTLVEEEEEEEEVVVSEVREQAIVVSSIAVAAPEPMTPTPLTVAITKPSPSRPRPASLNLRPLALASGNLVNAMGGLPTPTLTPGPRSSGLKSLSLATSQGLSNTSTNNNINDISTTGMRRQSLILTPSPTPPSSLFGRRPSLSVNCDSPSPLSLEGLKRPSSISYRSSIDSSNRNSAGLPTPDMTPIMSERKQLGWSADDEVSQLPSQRPLSASEQHFLFKSHNALLARITDLENALSSRRGSRPASVASDVSSNATSEPSDEMFSLLADLKAERDELKRDVDGWRTRVADLEDKVGVFAKRVEAERREAWVARSRLGLLEVEKSSLEQALQAKSASFRETLEKLGAAEGELNILKANNDKLLVQIDLSTEVEEECARLRAALEVETRKREGLEKDAVLHSTSSLVKSRHLFKSVDSESSLTDVEPCDDMRKSMTLNAVAEEEEDSYDSNEDNGLVGYEDEEDSDISFQSPGGSSVDSMDEYTRAALHLDTPRTPGLTLSDTSSGSVSPTPTLTPATIKHAPHNSLSKTWTFPSGCQTAPSSRQAVEEVDHFFGCLDDIDASPRVNFMLKDSNSKSLFSQGFGFGSEEDDDDEMPPFVLPAHVGIEVQSPSRNLAVVLEEEEEEEEEVEEEADSDFEGEEFEGGIRFTFNTSTPAIAVTPPAEPSIDEIALPQASKAAPAFLPFDEEEDEADVPFSFGKPMSQATATEPISSVTLESDSDFSFTARNASPSSIPRATVLKSFASSIPFAASTPPRTASTRYIPPAGYSPSAFMTPPSKRGGTMPSFIPQPVASPLKMTAPPKSKAAPTSTFMRQPQRKPVPSVTVLSGKLNANDSRSSAPASSHHRRSSSQMSTIPLSDDQETFSTPTLSSIMSLQTITNWWTPRSVTAAASKSCTIPKSSSHSSGEQLTFHDVKKAKTIYEKKYVSKDKQLEKLRARMDQERRIDCHGHIAIDICRTCSAGEVYL